MYFAVEREKQAVVTNKPFHNRRETMSTTKKPYAELRAEGEDKGPITFDEAKELIGWREEGADENWGTEFALKDMYGKKIRLLNNPTNRPLKLAIGKRYASEFLRRVWRLNLETIVFGLSGNVRDGQHRLVGFILAEQMRQLDPKQWGEDPLTMEVLLGFNVSDDKETADSYDKGQSRSLDDVIYRHEDFSQKTTDKEQRKISKTLSGALRMTWIRCGGLTVSSAPHFPHSEAMEFYEKHKGIMKSVKKIISLDSPQDEEGSTKLISSILSLGYASSLHYLMSKVDSDKANEFWASLASGEGLSKGSPILSLRRYLMKSVAGSGAQRDAIYGACVKAWNFYLEGSKAETKDIQVKRKKKGEKFVLAEIPRIGGLDVDKEAPQRPSLRQQRIIKGLKELGKEVTYEALAEATDAKQSSIKPIKSRQLIRCPPLAAHRLKHK